MSIVRDGMKGNLLDEFDRMDVRVGDLERQSPGLAGQEPGNVAYYRSADGALRTAAGVYVPYGFDLHIDEVPLAWARVVSAFLALPGLRGFWPMSSFDENGDAYDLSGQGRTLSYNGNPTYTLDGYVPWLDLDGTGDYLSRADEAGLDIRGNEGYIASAIQGMTLGLWAEFDQSATREALMVKGGGGATTCAYWLEKDASDQLTGYIGNGVGVTSVSSTGTMATDVPTFCCLRFEPSTELATFIAGEQDGSQTSGIPATLQNSSNAFHIGTYSSGSGWLLDGRVSLAFLCASLLSDNVINGLYQLSRGLFGV